MTKKPTPCKSILYTGNQFLGDDGFYHCELPQDHKGPHQRTFVQDDVWNVTISWEIVKTVEKET